MNQFSTLFVDLDQTIYPETSGIWEEVADRIQKYLEQQLGIDKQQAFDMRIRYHQQYGTTLRGLQHEWSVDPIDYMDFIHDVSIETKIEADPELPGLLESIQIPKYIFTNASSEHAVRVLRHLGVQDLFDGIIDIISLDYANKPDPTAYIRALQLVGGPPPDSCILLEDTLENLKPAAQIGFTTVHVGSTNDSKFTPDFQIETIHALFDVLPELDATQPSGMNRYG